MSAQQHDMGHESVPQHDQPQPCHPKAERSEAKKARDRPESYGPAYALENRFQPPVADKASPGDRAAHSYDGDGLCPKLRPADRQEFRGCKTRDRDRRTRIWNKQVYLGLIPGEEDADAAEQSRDSQ